MPAKSISQQQLFGMALAVRKGEMKKSDAGKEVMNIVNSDMTDKEIEDFAKTKHKGLKDHVKESICMDNFPRVFVVIKPGFLKYREKIIEMFNVNGYILMSSTFKTLTLKEAKELYLPHKDESFYDDLCKYMSSGLSEGLLFTVGYDHGEQINKFRSSQEDMIKEVESIKDKIRSDYGISEMKNVLHSSDSVENMTRESKIYF